MIIDLFLGPFCSAHNPLSFIDPYTNDRGLSGSDLIFFELAKSFKKLGHNVNLFTTLQPNQPTEWEGCKVYDFKKRLEIIDESHDAAITISEPEMLRGLPKGVTKIHSHQLNGFSYCPEDWEDLADFFISPSNGHLEHHKQFISKEKHHLWSIVPDGTDPDVYIADEKTPGKIISTSSGDRGLHWLLSMFPEIKKQVPHATLDIYYKIPEGVFEDYEADKNPNVHIDVLETAKRIVYIKEASKRMKHLGVNFIGSSSKKKIIKALSKAELFAFPCSTVAFTEGFSISTIEGCSAECAPVICGEDCLQDLYQGVVSMVPSPMSRAENQKAFIELAVKTLTDKTYREDINKKARSFALEHSWNKISKMLEDKIISFKQKEST